MWLSGLNTYQSKILSTLSPTKEASKSLEITFSKCGYISFQILQDKNPETLFRISNTSHLTEQKMYEGCFEMVKRQTQDLFSIFLKEHQNFLNTASQQNQASSSCDPIHKAVSSNCFQESLRAQYHQIAL